MQLQQLQQQHRTLAAVAMQPPPRPEPMLSLHHQPRNVVPGQVVVGQHIQGPPPRHNPAWSEQTDPESGAKYYWNNATNESTYTRPADYNPGVLGLSTIGGITGRKGPPGANLFVVRKMRRGEYDEFNDEDLAREFGKYGVVTRAEMTIDRESGWSKGFGFVSFQTPEEADAAIQGVHLSWMAGREMKVEHSQSAM